MLLFSWDKQLIGEIMPAKKSSDAGQKFILINSIPVQALAAPFWFHIFFITAFSGLGYNFFYS